MIDDDTKKKVISHYQKGQGSIQDIARVYRLEVTQVLQILGINDISTVNMPGDMISPDEAGPGADMNYGKDYPVPYSTN